jgi:3',5'-cyclic-AMP phosphodiesterase
MKFVILTDTHFVARGRKLYGLDPTERLAAAVDRINRDHPDISFVIVTGDLAHWGEDAAYENLASVLARLNAPTILLMGNHDKRDPFGRYFPGVARDPSGFVQSVHLFDAATVVTLDTLNEAAPDHAGIAV